MTMPSTVSRRRDPVQYAPVGGARDPKHGDASHLVRDAGLAPTPGAAQQLMLRRRAAVLEIVALLARRDAHAALDQYLAPLDELRLAGFHVALCSAAMVTIERADANDSPSRLAWREDPTTENARRAISDAQRAILTLHEFIRGVRTAHPELAA